MRDLLPVHQWIFDVALFRSSMALLPVRSGAYSVAGSRYDPVRAPDLLQVWRSKASARTSDAIPS